METVLQALAALLAAVLAALTPRLIGLANAGLDYLRERALLTAQQRLGEGAARVAGEILGEIEASPDVQAATAAMIQAGAVKLGLRFPETVLKRGIAAETLAGMVAGELGKLGVAVRR